MIQNNKNNDCPTLGTYVLDYFFFQTVLKTAYLIRRITLQGRYLICILQPKHLGLGQAVVTEPRRGWAVLSSPVCLSPKPMVSSPYHAAAPTRRESGMDMAALWVKTEVLRKFFFLIKHQRKYISDSSFELVQIHSIICKVKLSNLGKSSLKQRNRGIEARYAANYKLEIISLRSKDGLNRVTRIP